MNEQVKSFFLIGFPVHHSASPYIYNRLFAKRAINARYDAMAVKKEDLPQAIRILRKIGCGFNVTSPHKRTVVSYLEEIDRTAGEIGAVNTVVNRNSKLYGYNTDWIGVMKSLERHGIKSHVDSAVVIGAGGAARAVVYALAGMASSIAIVSQTGVSAVELARLAEKWGVKRAEGLKPDAPSLKDYFLKADLIVNASPVGGLEDVDSVPIPPSFLQDRAAVLDLVYNPLKTRLLREAELRGCRTIDGLWVLCYQAVKNLKLWLGIEPSVEELRSYGLEYVKGESQ